LRREKQGRWMTTSCEKFLDGACFLPRRCLRAGGKLQLELKLNSFEFKL
jgi:hypothetical protein